MTMFMLLFNLVFRAISTAALPSPAPASAHPHALLHHHFA